MSTSKLAALQTQKFIEDMTAFGSSQGIPRSTSRVLGLLLVCEPAHQSAEAIQASLNLSSGSVSNAVSMLCKVALVRRFRLPGDRKLYYEIDPDGWKRTLHLRMQGLIKAVEIADNGLKLNKNNRRLTEMRKVYLTFGKELEKITAKMYED